jgi:hypothetical protein
LQPTRPRTPPTPQTEKIIRLRDGTTLIGQIIASDAKVSWIKTSDGKTVEVPTKNIMRQTSMDH